jgi:cyclopropane-fatty-acyl-phospholipid synthase
MSEALARRFFLGALSRIRGGRLELAEGGRQLAFGAPGSELSARVEIRDPRAYRWALRGSTGLGEGYVDRLWSTDDLVALIRICCRNLPPWDRWRRRLHPLVSPLQRALELVPRNTRAGAAANISAHYDLGNELFESFLDRRLIYSCAYFPEPDASLDEAQLAKLERICERLELGPEDHLLEIGTGWGGLAIHAAGTRGCRVTTTTISREQHAYAVERVREAGLDDRVELLLHDYRDLSGSYDKLVSIEMIEAVGWQYFDAFFAKCAELLAPGGAMFLQAIAIQDDLYEVEKAARSFSNKHIFPGGCLPSLDLITRLGTANGLRIDWAEEISAHYARTLAHWRERFNDAWPALRPRGYDERFKRLWNFYLASSEGGFRERRIRDVQLLLARPRARAGATKAAEGAAAIA